MSWSSNAQMPLKPVGWWVNPTGPRDALRTTWAKSPSFVFSTVMAATTVLLSPAVVSQKNMVAPSCAAQAHSLAPTLSSTIALTAPTKNVNAQAVSPTVAYVRNMSITAPIVAAQATRPSPTVSATVAITSGIRTANATMVAPTFSSTEAFTAPTVVANATMPTPTVIAEKKVAATISRAETFMWLMVTVVAEKKVSAPIVAANATMPAPTVVTEKVVTAPISAANALSFAYSYFGDGPTVAYTANCSVTAPISRANASVATPTNVVAEKKISPPIAAAQATLPAPTVSQLSPLVVLAMRANTQMPKPTVVYGALYGFAASTVFNIPNQFAYFGIWGVGGGNGGTGGGASYIAGGGGAAGSWNGSTWERDVTLDITVRQLNINVGGGGAGGGCNLVPGAPGGSTSVTHQFGTMFIASGGNANAGWNDWTGRGAGNIDLYGYSIGGGYGNGGNGGAGGLFGCAVGGNPGAGGAVWVYAFTKPDWVPPIWTVIPNANATSSAPTVAITRNLTVAAPISAANATRPAPTVSATVTLTSPSRAANASFKNSPVITVAATKNVSITSVIKNVNATMPAPNVVASNPVTFDAAGAGNKALLYPVLGAPYDKISWAHTVAADAKSILVFVTTQYTIYDWNPDCVDVNGTNIPRLGYILYANDGTYYSVTWIYGLKINQPGCPSISGAKTITFAPTSANYVIIYTTGSSVSYKGVSNIGAPVTNSGNSTTPTLAMTNTPSNGMCAMGIGGYTSALSSFSGNQRWYQPYTASVNLAELIGDAAGTGGTVTMTASQASNLWGTIGVPLS